MWNSYAFVHYGSMEEGKFSGEGGAIGDCILLRLQLVVLSINPMALCFSIENWLFSYRHHAFGLNPKRCRQYHLSLNRPSNWWSWVPHHHPTIVWPTENPPTSNTHKQRHSLLNIRSLNSITIYCHWIAFINSLHQPQPTAIPSCPIPIVLHHRWHLSTRVICSINWVHLRWKRPQSSRINWWKAVSRSSWMGLMRPVNGSIPGMSNLLDTFASHDGKTILVEFNWGIIRSGLFHCDRRSCVDGASF